MKYFFIFGNHPDLSCVELIAKLRSEQYSFLCISYTGVVGIFTLEKELPVSFINSLGGIIKFGTCFENQSTQSTLASDIYSILSSYQHSEKRLTFGLSTYAKKIPVHRLGIEVKKTLKEGGHSVRFIAPPRNQQVLSSVSVEKNGLIHEYAAEIVIIESEKKFIFGKTLAVQAFESYSLRDWGRPERDMEVGLIPPKLAQIMINLTGLSPRQNPRIHDPFCGFGTILQEALCMGYTSVSGSDYDPLRVNNSKKNLQWLFEQLLVKKTSVPLFQSDVRKLAQHIPHSSLNAIVTEPHLGPITRQGEIPSPSIRHDLSLLYKKSFDVFRLVLKKGGVVVFLFPVWLTRHGPHYIPILDGIIRSGFINETIPHDYSSLLCSKTPRDTFIYMREGQGIAREICVLRKT